MSTAPATNPRRQRPARTAALAGTLASALLLSGCGTVLWETGQDMRVYFNNTTDQTLYVRKRDSIDHTSGYFVLPPRKTTQLQMLVRDECDDIWVIVTDDGKGQVMIVKDPGRICWHDTVTVP